MVTEASTSIKRLYRGWFEPREPLLAVTVFIRYQLDPFKRTMFEEYAGRWLAIIPDAAAISPATGCRMKAPTTSRSR